MGWFSGRELLFRCWALFNSATSWTAACQVSLFFTVSQSLFKILSIELVMSSNHHILCHSLLLLPSVFPSGRQRCSEMALQDEIYSTRWEGHSDSESTMDYYLNWFQLNGTYSEVEGSKSGLWLKEIGVLGGKGNVLKLGKRGKQEPQLSQRQGWIVDDGLRSITMGGHTWDFIPCSKWKSRTWEAAWNYTSFHWQAES